MSGCRTLVQRPFSVRALPPDLRISTITTDRGSTEPAAEGFISTVPGKGAFVPQLDSALVRGQLLRQVEGGCRPPGTPPGAPAPIAPNSSRSCRS